MERSAEEPKLFYNYIKSKTKIKDKIQSIADEGRSFNREEEMCEILNKNFQSVFLEDSAFEEDAELHVVETKMEDLHIRREEISDMMKSLDKRKANGPDEISCWVLQECAEELSTPLHNIFINSLSQGKLPNIWKRANIVPLYKKGNRENPLNYRPVSLTSVICKIMEKLIRKNWVEHLEKHKLLAKKAIWFQIREIVCYQFDKFYDRVSETVQERDGWIDCQYLFRF